MAQAEPGTPAWWLRHLHAKIVRRRPGLATLDDYYNGRHPLAFTSEKFREAFGNQFRAFADNWTQIVVDAVEERLTIQGVRVPTDDGTLEADRQLWSMWQHNNLDAMSSVAHTTALLHGRAYACVWPSDDQRMPDVTIEHPASAAVQTDPKRPRRRLAGLRLYVDEYGYEHGELFLPDAVHLYRSPKPRSLVTVDPQSVQWIVDTAIAPDGVIANPFGVVPMVELANRPTLWAAHGDDTVAASEIAQVIPLQNACNKLLADMLVASEFAAYPQRWLTGYEMERDPDTGQAQPLPFKPTSKVWALEDPEARFGAFPVADLGNYVRGVEMLVQHIASITRTPPHYLNASADRLSGESVKAAESGLVAKCRRKMTTFGNAWEEVARLMGVVSGNQALAQAADAEVIWADPESRTEAEHTDAMVKLRALDLPATFLWERLGLTPQEIDRARALQADEALVGMFDFGPAVAPVAPIVPGV
jgi:hypothetical protein